MGIYQINYYKIRIIRTVRKIIINKYFLFFVIEKPLFLKEEEPQFLQIIFPPRDLSAIRL